MVQTSFTVASAGSLSTVLGEISVGGVDAAIDTGYTIEMTAGILVTGSATLDAGSSVTLEGAYPFIASSLSVIGTIETDLRFTGTLTLDDGALINPAISVNATGTVVAGLFDGTVLGTTGDSGDTAINSGTIASIGTYAAIEFDTGTVQNGWNGATAALISGVPAGVALQAGGLVQNGGTVIGTAGTSIAVYLGAGTVDNGQISNTTALISGGGSGVRIAGAGVLENDGTIIGSADGGVFVGSGSVANGQLGAVAASIQGAGYGVWIGTLVGPGTVTNFGRITGSGSDGVYLQSGGTLTNGGATDTTALVTGGYDGALLGAAGTVLDYGTITANGTGTSQPVIGVRLDGGGTIDNLTTGALVYGHQWGALVEGGAGYVTNLGTVQAAAASGLGVDLMAGGTVTNGSSTDTTALILGGTSATADGVRVLAGGAGSGALVQNNGTIEGGVGVDFQSGATQAAGTLVNNGLIDGFGGDAVVFGTGAELLVLQPGGAFTGRVLGGATGITTLELADGTGGTLNGLAANSGTVTDSAGAFAFGFIQTISLDPTASWTIAGPGTVATLNNTGTVDFSGGTVTASQFANNGLLEVQNSASAIIVAPLIGGIGQIQLSSGGDLILDASSVPSTQAVGFAGASTLDIGTLAGFGAVIDSFDLNATIEVSGVSITSVVFSTGSPTDTLTLFSNGTSLGTLSFGTTAVSGGYLTASNGVVLEVPCFAEGTRIAGEHGEVAVEALRVGDRVRTLLGGAAEPIIWIGRREVDCAQHPKPGQVWPVRIEADAFGPRMPHRALLLSPDHAVYVNGALIPVKLLVNGSTIVQVPVDRIAYFHIELPHHDVVLAEGLAAESYLDIKDGSNYARTQGPVPLRPDCAVRMWEAFGCAPLIVTGMELERVREQVAAVAAERNAGLNQAAAA